MPNPPTAPVRSAWLNGLTWGLVIASIGIPVSLLWDFSWESTVGIDLAWSPAHLTTYFAIALAGCIGFWAMITCRRPAYASLSVHLWKFRAPTGAWMALWGALAFLVAVFLERWWQAAYGLTAGIWHPPQLLKATSFFVVLIGTWLLTATAQKRTEAGRIGPAIAFSAAGGMLLAMISVVSLLLLYPNRQHGAFFYQSACATYPIILTATAIAGNFRWSATIAALAYTTVQCAILWILPLFAARPEVAPIYQPLDHLLPPPFPLLLLCPALAIDALLRIVPGPNQHLHRWRQATETGLAFFLIFTAVQWNFSAFLLSPASTHPFFAGGGMHWPFFLKIDAISRVSFWRIPGDEMTSLRALIAVGSAILAARAGLWLGDAMKRLRR